MNEERAEGILIKGEKVLGGKEKRHGVKGLKICSEGEGTRKDERRKIERHAMERRER